MEGKKLETAGERGRVVSRYGQSPSVTHFLLVPDGKLGKVEMEELWVREVWGYILRSPLNKLEGNC